MAKDTVRIWGYLDKRLNDMLEDAADRFHVSKTVMIGLAIQFGLGAIDRAYEPEKRIDVDMWRLILQAGGSLSDAEKSTLEGSKDK